MALKPFYNKKGHLGMTRQQVIKALKSGAGFDPAAAADALNITMTAAQYSQLTNGETVSGVTVANLDAAAPALFMITNIEGVTNHGLAYLHRYIESDGVPTYYIYEYYDGETLMGMDIAVDISAGTATLTPLMPY